MRCPHCASPRASPPVCLSCGLPLDAPAAQPVMPGLEPTSAQPVPAPPRETVPGLEPTRQEVGEVVAVPATEVVPTRQGAGDVPVVAATEVVPTRVNLPDVAVERLPGIEILEDAGRAHAVEAPPPRVICSECGVPNPLLARKCLACGKRM